MYNEYCEVAKTQHNILWKGGNMEPLKFKGYCAEHNIRLAELAEVLKIKNIQNISEKLNGKKPWTLDQVKTLCNKYKISADEYFI